ncbi:hypothetical protein UT300013_33830 [Paraclostridium sordellii]
MKIVNPLGKTVSMSGHSADARGCMCNSGAQTARSNAGSCSRCACQCSSSSSNRQANFGKATAVVRY